MKDSLIRPAFLGGLLSGVLSALPLVSVGNCCCCLWIAGGGFLAAYLLQQGRPTAIDVGDGALAGLLAGIVGAIVATVLSVPIALTVGPIQAQIVERLVQNLPNIPPEMQGAFDEMRHAGVSALNLALGFLLWLVLGAIFSTTGGVLGAVTFRRGRPQVLPSSDAATPVA